MAVYFLVQLALYAATLAVVAVERLVVLAVGGEKSNGTFPLTACGLGLALLLWVAWRPRSDRAARIKRTAGRWYRSHRDWWLAHPIAAPVCDGSAIFLFLWLCDLVAHTELTVAGIAGVGGLIFAVSLSGGALVRRLGRRWPEA